MILNLYTRHNEKKMNIQAVQSHIRDGLTVSDMGFKVLKREMVNFFQFYSAMILLSFDIEEFDLPLEHGIEVPFEQQMAVSVEGTKEILACLKKHQVHATFFCTVNFAVHAPEIIKSILQDGHEIASHGYHHSSFEIEDLRRSREFLEQQTGQSVKRIPYGTYDADR